MGTNRSKCIFGRDGPFVLYCGRDRVGRGAYGVETQHYSHLAYTSVSDSNGVCYCSPTCTCKLLPRNPTHRQTLPGTPSCLPNSQLKHFSSAPLWSEECVWLRFLRESRRDWFEPVLMTRTASGDFRIRKEIFHLNQICEGSKISRRLGSAEIHLLLVSDANKQFTTSSPPSLGSWSGNLSS